MYKNTIQKIQFIELSVGQHRRGRRPRRPDDFVYKIILPKGNGILFPTEIPIIAEQLLAGRRGRRPLQRDFKRLDKLEFVSSMDASA